MTVFAHTQTTNKLVNEAANDSARVSGQDRKIPPALGTNQGGNPFNQNFRKFRSKTQWIGSVQPEKFRKNGSTFWGGPLFPVGPVGILVEWIAPQIAGFGGFRPLASLEKNNIFYLVWFWGLNLMKTVNENFVQ